MRLTSIAIKNALPRDKAYKLGDGGGLYLLIQPGGSKLWRMKYYWHGKERLLSFGVFPAVGLADARAKRDEARKQLAAGTDPSFQKKLELIEAARAAANTFGLIAVEYLENLAANGAAPATLSKNRWMLEQLAAPIANRPISEITPAELLDLLKRIERTGRRESARRLRGVIGGVYRLAIVTMRANNDPTFALRGALLRPQVQHRPAITDEQKLGALWRAIDEFDGWPTIKAALRFLMLTMSRPGEVRHMRRDEVNFERSLWRIPADRMKMRRQHEVPLSRQAIAVLKDVWPISDGGELVFPSVRAGNRPLSENAFNASLRRLGYAADEVTAHGFRSSASTILNERGYNPDVIEAALAHQDPNSVRRAYNRSRYWPERVRLLQDWADLLDDKANAHD